ncbi:protein YIPF5/7 [Enteropsectra breve]|nr:protein YIPF5/7 [Enteropsectra breve]
MNRGQSFSSPGVNRENTFTNKMEIRKAFFEGLEGESPLMDELGIDPKILRREGTRCIQIFRKHGASFETEDLMGPVVFLALFTLSLILHGKIHFGYIYLISLSSALFTYMLMNLISLKKASLVLCCNSIGYSLAPLIGFSLLNLFLRYAGLFMQVVVGLCVSVWCAYTASYVLCKDLDVKDKIGMVSYPLLLTYVSFTLMVLF